jgi:alpha-glucosidase
VVTASEKVNGIKKLRLKVWNDNVIQVISSPTSEFSTQVSLIITAKVKSSTDWNVSETENQLHVSTNSITAKIDKNNLKVSFLNKHGQQILTENSKEAQVVVKSQ